MVTCTYIVNNHVRVKGLRLENIMAKEGGVFCCRRRVRGADAIGVRNSDWSNQTWASAFAAQNELYYTEEIY